MRFSALHMSELGQMRRLAGRLAVSGYTREADGSAARRDFAFSPISAAS
jgi:hypothetical protein